MLRAYEFGWRLEHDGFGTPKFFTRLPDALVALLDLEARSSGAETVHDLREAIERAAGIVREAANKIEAQARQGEA